MHIYCIFKYLSTVFICRD